MLNRRLLELAINAAVLAGAKTLNFYREEIEVIVKDDNSPLTRADLESNQTILGFLAETEIPVLSEENKVVPYEERIKWETFWLIDPLDGTKEFINKRSEYTINIALIKKGQPVLGVVYAPVLRTLYYGMQDLGSFKTVIHENEPQNRFMNEAVSLTPGKLPEKLRIVASRSHLSDDTRMFIKSLASLYPVADSRSYGSSLKLCMVAEGKADIYPRLGPTMEWDTAASHAVATYAGSRVIETKKAGLLHYNKMNLLNPWFVVYHPDLDQIVRKILSRG